MAFSPLVDELKTTKKHSPRPGKVTRVIVHHWAHVGGIAGVLNKFVYSTRQSSVSYIMRNTGHLIGSVDERYRPWTSNSAAADNPAITIEIENETGAPNYKVSDASIEKLTQLLVDIARRHGWKQIRFGHEVRGHREFYATACPGPYLWPRLPAIAKEANRRLQGGTATPSKPKKEDWFTMATKQDLVDAVRSVLREENIKISGVTGRVLKKKQLSHAQLDRYAGATLFEGREQHADLVARIRALTAAVDTLAKS